jgi:heme exporter protein A
VWVLDEPFTALDVRGVAALSALITAHLERDGVVVLTTHQDVPIAGRVEKLVLVPAAAPGFVPDTDEDSDTQDATP